jgi:hypothetical protein
MWAWPSTSNRSPLTPADDGGTDFPGLPAGLIKLCKLVAQIVQGINGYCASTADQPARNHRETLCIFSNFISLGTKAQSGGGLMAPGMPIALWRAVNVARSSKKKMQAVKGMVLVDGATYRIVRTSRAHYDVVRISDDTLVGTFKSAPRVEVVSSTIEVGLLREIARVAIQGAKTSWVGRLEL